MDAIRAEVSGALLLSGIEDDPDLEDLIIDSVFGAVEITALGPLRAEMDSIQADLQRTAEELNESFKRIEVQRKRIEGLESNIGNLIAESAKLKEKVSYNSKYTGELNGIIDRKNKRIIELESKAFKGSEYTIAEVEEMSSLVSSLMSHIASGYNSSSFRSTIKSFYP